MRLNHSIFGLSIKSRRGLCVVDILVPGMMSDHVLSSSLIPLLIYVWFFSLHKSLKVKTHVNAWSLLVFINVIQNIYFFFIVILFIIIYQILPIIRLPSWRPS